MPKFTKDEIWRIRNDIRYGMLCVPWGDSRFKLKHCWNSHGYDYYFTRCWGVWAVRAGCRQWESFKEFRTHYKDKSWRRNLYSPVLRRRYRRESLEICDDMQKFARRFGIKLGERKVRRKKRAKRNSRR